MRILGCRRLDRQQRPSVVHCPPPTPSLPVDALRRLPWQLRRRVIFLGAVGSVWRASLGCPLCSRFPLRHRLMDLCTPAAPASPALGDSAVDCFNRAAAILRSAGTTAVRAAGSLAGAAPQVGGVDKAGGELQGLSLFCSCGGVVNVNLGGSLGLRDRGFLGARASKEQGRAAPERMVL